MILDTMSQLSMYNTHHTLNSQMRPHNPPSRASYGVSIVRILEAIDHVITSLHSSNNYCWHVGDWVTGSLGIHNWDSLPADCNGAPWTVNSSPPGQNGCRQYFQMHFREWKSLYFKISLKFVPKGSIDNKAALVQVMAWCRIGDKPLSEPMLI